jgi:hypothetical protein
LIAVNKRPKLEATDGPTTLISFFFKDHQYAAGEGDHDGKYIK